MSESPAIPWLDQLLKENPLMSRDGMLHVLVNNICDPSVHVDIDPDLRKDAPLGFTAIVDAEGDIVCWAPTQKAAEMARLLNEACG